MWLGTFCPWSIHCSQSHQASVLAGLGREGEPALSGHDPSVPGAVGHGFHQPCCCFAFPSIHFFSKQKQPVRPWRSPSCSGPHGCYSQASCGVVEGLKEQFQHATPAGNLTGGRAWEAISLGRKAKSWDQTGITPASSTDRKRSAPKCTPNANRSMQQIYLLRSRHSMNVMTSLRLLLSCLLH